MWNPEEPRVVPGVVPAASRREVVEETVVDANGAPVQRTVVRDVVRQPVVQPVSVPVARPVYVSAPRRVAFWLRDGTGARQILYYVVGLINALLLLRFVLFLLGANLASPFFQFIYRVTQPFVYPFLGLFSEPSFDGAVLEWASVVAILVYLLLAYWIGRTIDLWYARRHPATPEVW